MSEGTQKPYYEESNEELKGYDILKRPLEGLGILPGKVCTIYSMEYFDTVLEVLNDDVLIEGDQSKVSERLYYVELDDKLKGYNIMKKGFVELEDGTIMPEKICIVYSIEYVNKILSALDVEDNKDSIEG